MKRKDNNKPIERSIEKVNQKSPRRSALSWSEIRSCATGSISNMGKYIVVDIVRVLSTNSM